MQKTDIKKYFFKRKENEFWNGKNCFVTCEGGWYYFQLRSLYTGEILYEEPFQTIEQFKRIYREQTQFDLLHIQNPIMN